MSKRPGKHGCGKEIYLQFIPVAPSLRRISFGSTTRKIHSCPNRPLDIKTKKLIHEAVNDINNTSDIINRIYMPRHNLQFVREYLTKKISKINTLVITYTLICYS